MSIGQISDEAVSQQLSYLRRARRGELDDALLELGANGDVRCTRAIERREKCHRVEFWLLQKIGRIAPGLAAFKYRLTKTVSYFAQRMVEVAELRLRKLLACRLQSAGGAGLVQLQPCGAANQGPQQKHVEDDRDGERNTGIEHDLILFLERH